LLSGWAGGLWLHKPHRLTVILQFQDSKIYSMSHLPISVACLIYARFDKRANLYFYAM
jgi:hypothetical protein